VSRPTRRESLQWGALAALGQGCRPPAPPTTHTLEACRPGAGNEDGYRLWLRYELVGDAALHAAYRDAFAEAVFEGASPTIDGARREIARGLEGLLGSAPVFRSEVRRSGTLVFGTPEKSPIVAALAIGPLRYLGREGFVIRTVTIAGRACTVVAANEDIGLLYGAFRLLRHLQMHRPLESIASEESPRLALRMLNHWDNLDRTVERGYAGASIWNWQELPDVLSPQYEDYARANASLGINGAALTNVNANALVLTPPYLAKVAALANVFRWYGVRVYLTARFSAPIEIGGLSTADPRDPAVTAFWRRKAEEIYRAIPDFGGFLVKANAEGQPGPQDYGRTHAEGANVLADALAAHGGIVVWRAFVYTNRAGEDRAKQAYEEFLPLDGAFRDNVLLQVKNGPIDFQPREPFHPLFGAMKATPLIAEFQITQEYLGFATHLAYLATLFRETLASDTYAAGSGSTVARALHGIAGVANIGSARNWCGHPFGQANWYALGRLAWNPEVTAEAIADEWLRMTFTTDARFVEAAKAMMLGSREAVVDYMTPLGLHHIMAKDTHYGPGPWTSEGRADWTAVYYHRADREGLGFDRGATGSNAIAQYAPPLREQWGSAATCPETLLLWFHHVAWDARMRSGRTLWDELCHKYDDGVANVRAMRTTWGALAPFVDEGRHRHVTELLEVQEREARWWRDACLLYFQTFSNRPLPADSAPASHTLAEYESIQSDKVPGLTPR
jgi:alpha-glucuronidase